jgi:hypothetical protein
MHASPSKVRDPTTTTDVMSAKNRATLSSLFEHPSDKKDASFSTLATYRDDDSSTDSAHSVTSAHPRQRQQVSFCEESSLCIQQIPHELHEDEIPSMWYSAADYERIQHDNRRTIKLIKSGKCCSGSVICKRGLEDSFREPIHYLSTKEEIMNELLDKQIDLWMNPNTGGDHARLLAEAYAIYTCQYAIRAVVKGLHDWSALQATHTADSNTEEVTRRTKMQ